MLRVKKKNLDRREWYSDNQREFHCIYHKDSFMEGEIGLITFTGLEEPEVVTTLEGDMCIADNGYQWLELAPKDKNYVFTIMFRGDEIFQQYVDITLKNEVYENKDTVFYDLFLDVVLLKNGEPTIIDEDELEEALLSNVITKVEYELAKKTADEVVALVKNNMELLTEKFFEYRKMFQQVGKDGKR